MKTALFWSAGKDSAFALHRARILFPEIEIEMLVTTLNSEFKRISMHGIREKLLDRQAASLGIPLYKMWLPNTPTNKSYEICLSDTLRHIKGEGFEYVIFGDIFLEDLMHYREKFLNKFGLKGLFPLWKQNSNLLIKDFVEQGFEAVICCISSANLTSDYLGKKIDENFLKELPSGVDPCGENGEYHTFCFSGPIFNTPVTFRYGDREFKSLNVKTTEQETECGFWYLDLI